MPKLLCSARKLLVRIRASKLHFHSEESIQTLNFASRAKAIKNACRSNVTLGVKELQYLVEKMKKEILLLRGQLKSKGLIYRTVDDMKVLNVIRKLL
jgi:hypothetical protein